MKCAALCSAGSGQPLREGLKGPRMPAKQTKQPSVSGAESKSVRGLSWLPRLPGFRLGQSVRTEEGQKEKVNSQHSQSPDEIGRTHTHRRGFLTDPISNLPPATAKLGIRF